MIIQHNMPAMNAQRQLGINNSQTSKNLEKLSSGYKVNRASDDAAGLAISEKMRGQIRGLQMATNNTLQGINLIQTAEGGMNEIHAILQRMRELSVQSANGTYKDEVDREGLEKEYTSLKDEIDRISQYTNYNGIHLLDGTKTRGSGINAMVTPETPGTMLDWSNVSGDDLTWLRDEIVNVIIPQGVEKIVSTIGSFSQFSDSNITFGLSLKTGAGSAAAWATAALGSSGITLGMAIADNYAKSLTSNGSFNSEAARSQFETVIVHELTHLAMDVANKAGMKPGEPNRFTPWFVEGMAEAIGGGFNRVDAALGDMSDAAIKTYLEGNPISGVGDYPIADDQAAYGTGYLATMYLGYLMSGGGDVTTEKIADGLSNFTGEIMAGKSLDQAIADNTEYADSDAFEAGFPNDKKAYDFIRALAAATKDGFGSATDLPSSDLLENVGLNKAKPPTFLQVDATTDMVLNTFTQGDGGGNHIAAGSPIFSGLDPYANPSRDGVARQPIVFQIGANGSADQRTTLPIHAVDTWHLGLRDANGNITNPLNKTHIETQDNANDAISCLDSAINYASGIRATLGAMQNRLEHTVNNLGVTKENLQSSESSIRDVDMAKEMMEFTKNNILVQASQSMLAQANQLPQGVLQLLR